MRLLLDTHLLLWALEGDARLPGRARELILNESNQIFVSAMALWEIAIKSSLGKLRTQPESILQALPIAGFERLDFTWEHAAAVAGLPALHRDPFDRAMVAQAASEPMLLLSHDPQVAAYGNMVLLV